jgi:hypothetical protein
VSEYQKILGDSEVIFETADFPLSHLDSVQSALDGVMLKFDIACTCLNETANRIDIHLRDNTKQKDVVEFLKTVFNGFDDRCLAFKDDPVDISTTAVDLFTNSLMGSNTSSSTEGATIGFNAYRHQLSIGVVTAGIGNSGTIFIITCSTIGSETEDSIVYCRCTFFVGNNIDESYEARLCKSNADCVMLV